MNKIPQTAAVTAATTTTAVPIAEAEAEANQQISDVIYSTHKMLFEKR